MAKLASAVGQVVPTDLVGDVIAEAAGRRVSEAAVGRALHEAIRTYTAAVGEEPGPAWREAALSVLRAKAKAINERGEG